MATIGKITVSALTVIMLAALCGAVSDLMDASRQMAITIGGVGGIIWCFFYDLIWSSSPLSSKEQP